MGTFLQRSLALLFPARCLFCGQATADGKFFCLLCADRLEEMHQGVDVSLLPDGVVCGEPVWHENCGSVVAPFPYSGMVRKGIHAFKFDGQRQAAAFFAGWMVRSLREYVPAGRWDLVTAVPMHPQKRRERGYDQSAVLAKEVARQLSLPLRLSVLKKVHENETQHLLSRRERRRNVQGIFQVPPREQERLRGKCILLVDDIVTTGATSDEIAGVLCSCGAIRVDAVFAAATRLRDVWKDR